MASVAYSRPDQYVFITQKRNSCVFSLLGNNTEYSFSASVHRLVRDMKGQTSTLTPSQSKNAAANQLDIF